MRAVLHGVELSFHRNKLALTSMLLVGLKVTSDTGEDVKEAITKMYPYTKQRAHEVTMRMSLSNSFI